jgi:hypothetical protein
MKTVLLLMVSITLFMITGAQTTEFLSAKDFQVEKKKLADGINAAKKTAVDAKKALSLQKQTIDSLSRLLSDYQGQLVKSNDSITSLNVKVNALQNQVNQKKIGLRIRLILVLGFIFLLVVVSFIWIFMIKKKSDQNFLSLSEAGDKLNNKIDQGLNLMGEDVRGCKELIKVSSNELNQQLRTGLEHFEIRAGQIEQQIKDYTGIIDGKLNKTREENDILLKKQDEKLGMLQSLLDQKSLELTALINSVEKNQKGIAPGIMDNLSSLRTQLEEKIKSVSAEISKLKMK